MIKTHLQEINKSHNQNKYILLQLFTHFNFLVCRHSCSIHQFPGVICLLIASHNTPPGVLYHLRNLKCLYASFRGAGNSLILIRPIKTELNHSTDLIS